MKGPSFHVEVKPRPQEWEKNSASWCLLEVPTSNPKTTDHILCELLRIWKTWFFFFRLGAARDWMFKLVVFHPTPLVWWQTLLFGSFWALQRPAWRLQNKVFIANLHSGSWVVHIFCAFWFWIFLCRTHIGNQYTKTNNSPLYYRFSNCCFNFLAFLRGFSVHCFCF